MQIKLVLTPLLAHHRSLAIQQLIFNVFQARANVPQLVSLHGRQVHGHVFVHNQNMNRAVSEKTFIFPMTNFNYNQTLISISSLLYWLL